MANFPALKLTDAGIRLQAKAQTGAALTFTRVALGDGAQPANPGTLLGLVHECQSLAIQDNSVRGDGTATLRVIMTNQGVATGFYMRELGVFARDPDSGAEQLYSYSNATDQADYLPPAGGATVWEGIFDVTTVVGNAANVSALINDYITIALKADLDAIRPYLLPKGGLVGQMVRKRSNAEGDFELFDPAAGMRVNLTSVEEPRVAVEGQRVFTLQKTVTNGLAVYVAGKRIKRGDWTALGSKQVQLTDALAAGVAVLFVNNEEAGPARALNVSLDGPTLVYKGSNSNTFTITDFDAFSVYDVATSVGTLTRSAGALTLAIPSDATATTADLTIKRDNVLSTFRVAIGAAAIAKPEMTYPTAGASGVSFSPDLTAAPFVVYPSGYDTHKATRWQIANDAAFSSLVFDSGADAASLTAISLEAKGVTLSPSTIYYVRAQFIGATLVSEWSTVVQFATVSRYVARPSLTAPTGNATGVPFSPTLAATAFATAPSGSDTHQSSRWQISKVADFSALVHDSGETTSKLTSYSLADAGVILAGATQYYARVRYTAKTIGASAWSPVVAFTTADTLAGTYTSLSTFVTKGHDYHTGAALAGVGYVQGGYYSDGSKSPSLWAYGKATGSWTQKADAPLATVGGPLCPALGKLYRLGGVTQSGSTSPSYWRTECYAYDPAANTWAAVAGLSVGTAHMAADVLADKVYVFGGATYNGYLNTFSLFDPAKGEWSVLPTGPSARANATLTALGGKLYLFGGQNNLANAVDRARPVGATGLNDLWCYDPVAKSWTSLATGPVARHSHVAAAINGKLYIYGGNGSGANDNNKARELWCYDPATNKWTQLTPSNGYGLIYACASFVLGTSIYVNYGLNPNGGSGYEFIRID